MEVTHDMSIVHLISNASVLVQLVMLALLGVSLLSWWYIFIKMFAIRKEVADTRRFESEFWQSQNLNELYRRASDEYREDQGAMERIFAAGFVEFVKLKKQPGMSQDAIMEGVDRAMRACYHREIDRLDMHLSFLASVGSVSPYVGLFGTVWGIMNSFRSLGNMGQVTLAHVAPGIAEALIATAMGLFAAIPAVVAYNRYSHEVDRLGSRFESFTEEFANILQRQS